MMMMAAATSARTSNTAQMNISEMSIRRWIVQCFLSARSWLGSRIDPIHCAQLLRLEYSPIESGECSPTIGPILFDFSMF